MMSSMRFGCCAVAAWCWLGPARGAVPATIAGGEVIHTEALAALLLTAHPVLIDVAPAKRRPPSLPANAVWLPLPHQDIAGSVWIPDAGLAAPPEAVARFYRDELARRTHGDRGAPIVVYCHPDCWLSWNAARRAIAAGYRAVSWYPDGVEGWQKAGHATAPAVAAGPGG